MQRGERQRETEATSGGETETDSYRFTSGTRSGACARHELGIVGNNGGVLKLQVYPRSNQRVESGPRWLWKSLDAGSVPGERSKATISI